MKRGARPSSSDPRRERASLAPSSGPKLPPLQRTAAAPPLNKRSEPYRDEQARSVVPQRSEVQSLSEEARAYGRDDQEAQLWEQFFSWPPPAPRAADLTVEPFERAPLPRSTRRAIWASCLMLVLSVSGIGGYFAYHNYVMPAPAALGDWSDTEALPLPTPILADDIAHADPEPRSVYQASLQHDMSAIKQAEPVADEAPAASAAPTSDAQAATATAEPAAQAEAPASASASAAQSGQAQAAVGAAAPSVPGAPLTAEALVGSGAHGQSAARAESAAPAQGEVRVAPGATAPSAPGAQAQGASVTAEALVGSGAHGQSAARAESAAPAQGEVRVAPAAPSAPGASVGAAAMGAHGPSDARAAVGGTAPSTPGAQAEAAAAAASSVAAARASVGAAPAAQAPSEAHAVAPGAPGANGQAEARAAVGTAAPSAPAAPGALAAKTSEARAATQVAEVKPVPAADAAVSFYEQLSVAQQQLAQGELRQSLPTFERALALRAHSVDALLGKATALFGLKEYDAAKSSAQLALAIDPRSNEAFALIGGSLEWLGHRAAAKSIYERCVEEAVDSTVCRERLDHLTVKE